MDAHISMVHLNEKLNPCDKCDSTFSSKSALANHLNTHLDMDERKLYKCDRCNKSFTSLAHVDRHEKEIHEKIKRIRKRF